MATAWYGKFSEYDDTTFIDGRSAAKQQPIDPAERQYLLGQVSLATWAFVRSMKRHLSPPAEDEEAYVAEIKARLTPERAEALISANHRPNRALTDLSVAIEKVSGESRHALPYASLRSQELLPHSLTLRFSSLARLLTASHALRPKE